MREGEIDFVASENLTSNPFQTWTLLRRSVRVDTTVEIIAKELWHRGDRLSARDLFDLSLLIEHEPEALRAAARFLVKHRAALLNQLDERAAVLKAQFEAIYVLRYKPRFEVLRRAPRPSSAAFPSGSEGYAHARPPSGQDASTS